MTLDEAIRHCEDVAEELEEEAKEAHVLSGMDCMECAEEHRQLAEWLKELKDYKDARVGCEYCKHKFREEHERPCSLCQRNFMDMFESKVNANGDSD